MMKKLIVAAVAALAASGAAAQRPGTTCATPYGWCQLPGVFQPGTQCYCATPQGPIYGVVR